MVEGCLVDQQGAVARVVYKVLAGTGVTWIHDVAIAAKHLERLTCFIWKDDETTVRLNAVVNLHWYNLLDAEALLQSFEEIMSYSRVEVSRLLLDILPRLFFAVFHDGSIVIFWTLLLVLEWVLVIIFIFRIKPVAWNNLDKVAVLQRIVDEHLEPMNYSRRYHNIDLIGSFSKCLDNLITLLE